MLLNGLLINLICTKQCTSIKFPRRQLYLHSSDHTTQSLVDKTGDVIKKVKFDMMCYRFDNELLKLLK